ncbi:hypothetical protein [Curtobacterium citreum]|uniref:hypothetical protein n=1 Tax=Curtobacterium citreum TaxID=2036 RepID=UPI0025431F34|nr:hypothetical protein [Curtobacterium citreum]WIJ46181.1 hypothetical protein QPK07_04230 [Curtobacterium citreum]
MSSGEETKPSRFAVFKAEMKSRTGNFSQSFAALFVGMVVAGGTGILISLKSPDVAFATMGVLGFGIGAAAAICRAYAHDVKERKQFDYAGKLLTIAALAFTGVALAGKFSSDYVWAAVKVAAALGVLIACVSLVRHAWVKDRDSPSVFNDEDTTNQRDDKSQKVDPLD